MALLLAMEETCSEWCPLTDRRVLTWFVRHAAVLGGGLEPTTQWDHETLFHPPDSDLPGSQRMAGFPAPGDPAMDAPGEAQMWQLMLRANWQAYCDRLPGTSARRFYVEPSSPWVSQAMVMAEMPYRTLLVARDPRSELTEVWLQGRRTGCLPHDLTHVDTPLSFAERSANFRVRDRLREFAAIQPSDEQICLRYEDIVERPAEAWQKLRAWLRLPERPAPAVPTTGHEWPTARWRNSLPQDVDALYRLRMAREMEAFGYEL